jgi:hypothetical protein
MVLQYHHQSILYTVYTFYPLHTKTMYNPLRKPLQAINYHLPSTYQLGYYTIDGLQNRTTTTTTKRTTTNQDYLNRGRYTSYHHVNNARTVRTCKHLYKRLQDYKPCKRKIASIPNDQDYLQSLGLV